MSEYINRIFEQIIENIPNILTALLIFILCLYFARLLSKLLRRVLQKRNVLWGVSQLLSQLLFWSIVIAGLITALQRFFDVTAFLTGLGIIGFTVGFALQDIMKNFAAGVVLLIQQPFRIRDIVNIAGFDGTVLVIDLRSTEIKTLDGLIVNIPNAQILSQPIVNYTRAIQRRVKLSMGISYDTDTELARKVVLDTIQLVHGFIPEPAPVIAFENLGNLSVEMIAFFWIDGSKTNIVAAKDAALTQIKSAFEERGIRLPYSVQTVYLEPEK